jgi:hypothetical protein
MKVLRTFAVGLGVVFGGIISISASAGEEPNWGSQGQPAGVPDNAVVSVTRQPSQPLGINKASESLPATDVAGESFAAEAERLVEAHKKSKFALGNLEAHHKQARLRAEIAENLARCRAAGGCMESAPPPPAVVFAPPPDSTVAPRQTEFPAAVPALTKIVGKRAVFSTTQGLLYAAPTESLPGGFKVDEVTVKEVVLSRDGNRYRLTLPWEPSPTSTPLSAASALPGGTMPSFKSPPF